MAINRKENKNKTFKQYMKATATMQTYKFSVHSINLLQNKLKH